MKNIIAQVLYVPLELRQQTEAGRGCAECGRAARWRLPSLQHRPDRHARSRPLVCPRRVPRTPLRLSRITHIGKGEHGAGLQLSHSIQMAVDGTSMGHLEVRFWGRHEHPWVEEQSWGSGNLGNDDGRRRLSTPRVAHHHRVLIVCLRLSCKPGQSGARHGPDACIEHKPLRQNAGCAGLGCIIPSKVAVVSPTTTFQVSACIACR